MNPMLKIHTHVRWFHEEAENILIQKSSFFSLSTYSLFYFIVFFILGFCTFHDINPCFISDDLATIGLMNK